MRFDELAIKTQREAPSNSRTEGFAFLVRAGYLGRDSQPLELGRRVAANVRKLHAGLAAKPPGAFFARLGLPVLASRVSEEFYFPIAGGANEILSCPGCGYASRRELSGLLKRPFDASQQALPLEKVATPDCSTIEALAAFLRIPKERTAKAVMYTRPQDGRFVFSVVRGDMQLSEAKLCALVGAVRPATEAEIVAAGAVPGYASPVGLRDALVIVDDLLPRSPNLAAGANQAGYHLLNVNFPRDFQAGTVADIVLPRGGDGCPECGAPLLAGAAETLADRDGIRFDALLLPLAETHHDEKGLSLPKGIAPFDVYLMSVPGKNVDTTAPAGDLYSRLSQAGFSVLYDDRDERAGIKFNDADLIGCPLRLTVGERGLQNGMVELKPRQAAENRMVRLSSLAEETRNELARNE